MDDNEIIKSAGKRFDSQLHTEEYRKIHSDSEHLENLIRLIDIKDNKSYLDIGTGNGYSFLEVYSDMLFIIFPI
jgi:predicted O-methyltransferase YrrM